MSRTSVIASTAVDHSTLWAAFMGSATVRGVRQRTWLNACDAGRPCVNSYRG
jgi:hypothetical protein